MMEYIQLETIKKWMHESEVFVLLIGAGMGADSGIPTYRGEDGSWGKIQDKYQKDITEIMTPQFINDNLEKMWERFHKRIDFFRESIPHKGYYALLEWMEQFNKSYFCLSSNIDGQLLKTGFEPQSVAEIHGNIQYLQCIKPCRQEVWPYEKKTDVLDEGFHLDMIPRCPYCGEFTRPNVLLFKDTTFVRSRAKEQRAEWDNFLQKHRSAKILAFEIGAGVQIKNIRLKTKQLMESHDTKVLRVNPDYPEIDEPHIGIAQKALETIFEIDFFLKNKI